MQSRRFAVPDEEKKKKAMSPSARTPPPPMRNGILSFDRDVAVLNGSGGPSSCVSGEPCDRCGSHDCALRACLSGEGDGSSGDGGAGAAATVSAAAAAVEHVSQVVATRDVRDAAGLSVIPSVVDLLAANDRRLTGEDLIFCRMDTNGIVKEWNDAASVLGWTREEVTEKPLVQTFIIPELRQTVKQIFEEGIHGKDQRFVMEQRTKRDETRFLLVDTRAIRDPGKGGDVVGLAGYARDITREVMFDRSVSAMFQDHQMLVQTANAPIFGVDPSLRVNEWNEYCISITGFVSSDVVGLPFIDTLVAPACQDLARHVLERALKCGEGTADYEIEILTKQKETRIWQVNANPRLDPNGKVFGVIGVAQDVTDDRKLENMVKEMEISNKTKDEMLEAERSMTAYFAHELRNPLHAIDSALQAMPDDLPESSKSLVNAMQLCTSFMSSIMNNLLDVRKIEEGKMTLNLEPMSLSNLVRTVHEMLSPSVRPGVDYKVKIDTEGKDWVLGDAHRLQQVLTNVVTNAIKYTMEGSISLSIGWQGYLVRIECEDTGPGIPIHEQSKLFRKFVQRGGAPGSGLGLAIAKNIVDLSGGMIYFKSDPTVRPGTTCVIKVPMTPSQSPMDQMHEVELKSMITENISFLIIDDIQVNRTMLGRRVKKCIAPNATIREAQTGEEALKICLAERFDVIVVDHHMDEAGGVMVGSDVVIAMRRMGIHDIIIGCSGHDSDAAFKGAGCDLIWGKPMPPNTTVVRQLSELFARKARHSHKGPQCCCGPGGPKIS